MQINKHINHLLTINLLILVLNGIIVYYLMSLAYLNHFSQDDYGFYLMIRDGNFFDIVKSAYFTFSGRYADYLYISLVYQLMVWGMPIWIVQAFIIVTSSLIIYKFLRIYYDKSIFLINISLLIINIFIFINFEFTAFYWTCATVYYWMAILPIALFVVIISKHGNLFIYPILLVLTIFIGGLSEVIVPICILLLVGYIVYLKYSDKLNFHDLILNQTFKRIAFTIFFLVIGFFIIYFSPGSNERKELYHQTNSFLPLIKISFHSLSVYFYLFFFKIPYLLPLLFVFGWYGYLNRLRSRKEKIKIQKWVILLFVLFIIFVWINVLPTSYVMSGFGFQRIYTHTILYSQIFFLLVAYQIGARLKEIQSKILIIITYFFLIGLSVSFLFRIRHDLPQAKAYLESDQKRVELLLDLQKSNFTGIFELDSLEKPGTYNIKYLIIKEKQPMLYYLNEIDTIPNAFPNTMMKEFYKLDYDIILKK